MTVPNLVLGPLLRHVDNTSATVWVEVDRACTVEIAGARAPTFCVGGHHYALVVVDGLTPGSVTPYQVHLDGHQVWPPAASRYPDSRIRAHGPDQGLGSVTRVLFGSCRYAAPLRGGVQRALGGDALDAYAEGMAQAPDSEWADGLVLLGDQVYADRPPPGIRERIRARRDTSRPPGEDVLDFEEYTWLYQQAWTDPDIRWLMSTVPTSMIFDDHDVHDDWNTSRAWRQKMERLAWWHQREQDALVSYWVYQHIGNLSPTDLANDAVFEEVQRTGHTDDAIEVLRRFARYAVTEQDGLRPVRFSYRRDFGPVRLVMIDTRCGRILGTGRQMLSEPDFAWLDEATGGDYRHLLIGSSLPWLMPHAVHHSESSNERACRRRGWRGRLAEELRQAIDLEHWPAFRESFDRLTAAIGAVARGERTDSAPATISVLSGDVHHSYVAEANYPDGTQSRVWQLTCSPVHNAAPGPFRLAFRAAWTTVMSRTAQRIARRRGVPPVPVRWTKVAGPSFQNKIACMEIRDDRASVTYHPAHAGSPPWSITLT